MQHVPVKWIHRYNLVLVGLDVLLFFFYWYFQYSGASQATIDKWGITPTILIIAAIHAGYSLLVYPFIRKYNEWITYAVSTMIYGVLLASIIETSGNTNLWYRLAFALWVFFLNLIGPYLAIAAATLAWILFLITVLSIIPDSKSSVMLNLIIDSVVTVAAFSGWFFFKRYYVKKRDQETIELANLLEQEQVKSSVVLESITDGVIVVNTRGAVQIINSSAAAMFGWTREEAMHIDYQALYKLQDKENQQVGAAQTLVPGQDVIAQVLTSGQPHQTVALVSTRHDRQFYADIVASPIKGEVEADGATHAAKLVGVIVVIRDVDKQKKEEQQRTEFISTASHEMRTPVAAIEGYLALAMNDKVCLIDEKARGYLEKAHTSTQHLGQLFQDLLTSAKADDGRLASHPQVIEIGQYLEQLVEDLKFSAQKKGLGIEFVVGSDDNIVSTKASTGKLIRPLYYTEADPDRLREVITNLFDNAVKYTPAGKITIGLTGDDKVVQFYLQDTGGGIAPEDVPHLFQKFYRVDNSATRTIGGTGLGLFICRKIIELYNGRIWVKSQLGKGSTFFVNLPRLDDSQAEAARLRLANTTQPQTENAPVAQPAAQAKPTVVQ